MEKLKMIRDDDYEQTYVAKKDNNGDWDWYPVIRLEYTDEWGDDCKDPYHISLQVVSPQAAGEQALKAAFDGWGEGQWDKEGNEWMKDPLIQVEHLLSYGTSACMWQKFGKNKEKLMKEAREELPRLRCLFGFYMDRPLNMIGNTGWDFVSGNIGFGKGGK